MVGTLLSASAELLPKAIIKLKQQHPQILITVKVGTVEELFPALLKGELDLVVGRLPNMDSKFYQIHKLEHHSLYTEKLSLVVAHQHELLQRTSLNFIGCMSSIVAEQMVSLNVLAKLPFPEIGDDIDVGYSKRKNEELTPACLKFITCLQAEG